MQVCASIFGCPCSEAQPGETKCYQTLTVPPSQSLQHICVSAITLTQDAEAATGMEQQQQQDEGLVRPGMLSAHQMAESVFADPSQETSFDNKDPDDIGGVVKPLASRGDTPAEPLAEPSGTASAPGLPRGGRRPSARQNRAAASGGMAPPC